MNKELEQEFKTKYTQVDYKTRKLINDARNARKRWDLLRKYEPDPKDKNYYEWETYIGDVIDKELDHAQTELWEHLKKKGIKVTLNEIKNLIYETSQSDLDDKATRQFIDKIVNPFIGIKSAKQPKLSYKMPKQASLNKLSRGM